MQRLSQFWILSLGFIHLLHFPFLETKLQWTEILFVLLLFIYWLRYKKQAGDLWKEKRLIWPVVGYLSVVLFSSLYHFSAKPLLELAGLLYLAVSFLLIQELLSKKETSGVLLQKAFIGLGVLLAALNWIIFILLWVDIPGLMHLTEPKNIPYLGDVLRIQAFMPSANLLANLMACSLFLSLVVKNKLNSLFMLSGMALTYSKSLLIIVPLAFWILAQSKASKGLQRVAMLFFLFSTILFLFFTHYLPSRAGLIDGESYVSGKVVWENEHLQLNETTYLKLKELAFQAGATHPVAGMGPGRFNKFLELAKETGAYPARLPAYDPHSTIWGAYAELGIPGLLALGVFVFSIAYLFSKTSSDISPRLLALNACLLLLAIEMISMDVLNFRHLWILLGWWCFEKCQVNV